MKTEHERVGYIVSGTILFMVVMMCFINQFVTQKRILQPASTRN